MAASPKLASEAEGAGTSGNITAAPGNGPYVLNLCSSTTPMALAQTDLPELKRFTFFVSRRFEEGRERFRLHMGHFSTLAEAEEWLNVVREIYPGAWAGEAPGRKLRERAAAAAAQAAPDLAPSGPAPAAIGVTRKSPSVTTPTRAAAAPVPVARAGSAVPRDIPVLQAARSAPRPPAAPAARSVAPVATPAAPSRAAPPAAAPVRAAAAPQPRTPASAAATSRATSAAQPARPGRKHTRPVFEDSNVREVLKALGEASATGETRVMPTPPPAAPRPAARQPGASQPSLSDTQVLRLLEARRSDDSPSDADSAAGSVPMLKPDDSGTRRALKEAVVNSAPVAFAVQLQWSVQPAEPDKVPPLAIFSAYTLYTVEGSREGRKWYGLRLGFFSDAISAKQVAHYVRSEFASVAVVPVSSQEKMRAISGDGPAPLAAPSGTSRAQRDEFKLLDDDTVPTAPVEPQRPQRSTVNPRAAKVARAAQRVAAGRAIGQSSAPSAGRDKPARSAPGRVSATERRSPQTLEETLEILGASELSIDDESGENINDTGVRHLRIQQVQKNSPFSRLLERLSERAKKS